MIYRHGSFIVVGITAVVIASVGILSISTIACEWKSRFAAGHACLLRMIFVALGRIFALRASRLLGWLVCNYVVICLLTTCTPLLDALVSKGLSGAASSIARDRLCLNPAMRQTA